MPVSSEGSSLRELRPGETGLAFRALAALRPHLHDEVHFVDLVDRVQRPEGYRLVAAFEPDATDAVAVAGFRLTHSLSWGRYLYVDDLSTLPEARGRGHARRLLRWLVAEADRERCEQLHLDSSFGAERTDAHRLYLNERMAVAALHFARRVREG